MFGNEHPNKWTATKTLFSIFINSTDKETECILSWLSDDTKLGGVAAVLTVLQLTNTMRYGKSRQEKPIWGFCSRNFHKCKILYLKRKIPVHQCRQGRNLLFQICWKGCGGYDGCWAVCNKVLLSWIMQTVALGYIMSNVVSRSRKVITPLSTQCLWDLTFNNALGLHFKDIEKLERAQCRAAMKATGLEERLNKHLFILVKRSSGGIYWEPVKCTWSDKDDVIKLFTEDTEGTMAQNCPLEGSNWSFGKYSSSEEQRSTGRGYLQKR